MPSVIQIRIMSLGELVTPNIPQAIKAFATIIAKKKSTEDVESIGKLIGLVIQRNFDKINDFKLGNLSENQFKDHMIEAINHNTGVKLYYDEFEQAWNAMNPFVIQFEALIKEAAEYNKGNNQQLYFVSFTNPIDIRHLINELKQGGIDHQVSNDALINIAGIPLLTTYTQKKSKAELIQDLYFQLMHEAKRPGSDSVFFKSDEPVELNIIYIRGNNEALPPLFKPSQDATNQEIQSTTDRFSMETVVWDKKVCKLAEILMQFSKPQLDPELANQPYLGN